MRYPVTPTLSVAAVQARLIRVADAGVAERLPGAVGASMSPPAADVVALTAEEYGPRLPAASAARRESGPWRHPGGRPGRLPGGRPADYVRRPHHASVVPAGVRPGRAGREDVPPAGVHQVVRHAGRRPVGGHARPGPLHRVRPRPVAGRGGSRSRPRADPGLSSRPGLPARTPGPDRLVRRPDIRPRCRPARACQRRKRQPPPWRGQPSRLHGSA